MAPHAKRGKVRSHGDGALYFSETLDRWVGVVTIADPAARDGRRRIKVTGKDKATAKAKLDEALGKIKQGIPVGPARETVADVLRSWLERGLDRKKIKSPNTIDGLTWAIEKHLVPAIGGHKLRRLDCDHVEDMLMAMVERGMSTSSLTRVHTTLTRALTWAQRRGKVDRNVSALVETPAGTDRPSQALTVAQVSTVLETAKADRLEALWVLGLVLGMRPGELAGLRWAHVDFDAGVITIWESLKHRKGELWQGDTKTRSSRRKIGALPIALSALKMHRARQAAERLAAGPLWTDTGYVFTTETGAPINPATLRRAFRALLKTAGIPDKQPTEECPKPGQWHPHEMRHSAGSYMDAMGVSHERIAEILGHKGTRTTEAVYIQGQEVIDMTSAAFETFGNQFGNQTAEGSH
jgi:integrase